MPEEAVAPEAAEATENHETEAPTSEGAETDLSAELDKWKALARKNEQRAKENAEAATAWAKHQESQKSEDEKRSEALAAAERRAAEAEDRLMRMEIAAEKGLTAAQAKRLVGKTREELEADADELLEAFGANKEPEKPRPADPDAGARSSAPTQVSDDDLSVEELVNKYHR